MTTNHPDQISGKAALSAGEADEQNRLFVHIQYSVLVAVCIYVPTFFYFEATFSAISVLVGLLLLAPGALILHHKKHVNAAKYTFILSCNYYVYAASLGLNHRVNAEYYFLPAMMLSLLIFDLSQIKKIMFGFAVPMLCWLLMKIDYSFLEMNVSTHCEISLGIIRNINFLGSFLLTAAFLTLFIKSSSRRRRSFLYQSRLDHELVELALIEKTHSEVELEEFFHFSPESMCVLGMDGQFKRVNPSFANILGHPIQDILGLSLMSLVHESDRSTIVHAYRNMGIHQNVIRFEVRMLTHSGANRILTWAAHRNIMTEKIYATAIDVTEERKHQSEIKLKESEKEELRLQLEEAQDLARMGSWSQDFLTQKIIWSKQMYVLLNQDPDKGPTRLDVHFDSIHPDDIALWQETYQKITLDGGPHRIKIRSVSDGKTIWIESISHGTFNDAGVLVGMAGTCQNITEQVTLENNLAVERANLINASKMATLGEMSAGIAHEINNPLAVIVGKTEKLQRRLGVEAEANASHLVDLATIIKTTHRIGTIIKGLRTFSRNSDNDPFEDVNTSLLVHDTLALCQERFSKHNVQVKIGTIEELIFKGRATQISQIILNLLNNAFDAIQGTEDAWIHIDIMAISPSRFRVVVTDSGNGIPEAVAKKIMNPFFTTKDTGKGTGLGLSISLGLAEDHGGSLQLDRSAENTTFILELPLASKKAALKP